jgi:hypothetical protein
LVEDQESEFLPEISASMLFKNVLENWKDSHNVIEKYKHTSAIILQKQ